MLHDYVVVVDRGNVCLRVYMNSALVLTIALPESPWRVAHKPHTDLVAVTSESTRVIIIDICTGQVVRKQQCGMRTNAVTFSRDGTGMYVGGKDSVEVWNTESADASQWRRLQCLYHCYNEWVYDASVTHDNATIVAGDCNGTATVWVVNSTTQVYEKHQRITPTHNGRGVFGAAITGDGSHIFTATCEGLHMFSKKASGEYAHVGTVAGSHSAPIRLSPDGSMLTVKDKVYCTSDLTLLHDMKRDRQYFLCGGFSSDGSLVAVSAVAETCVYRTSDGSLVNKYDLSSDVTDVCFVSRRAPARMCAFSRIVRQCVE